MLVKKISYIDFDGNERTDDFYFNLNKAEQLRILAHTKADDIKEYINELVEKDDYDGLANVIEDIIVTSYGIKDESGRFVKDKELQREFLASDAYGNLFIELITEEGAAQEFGDKVVPHTKGVSAPASVTKKK